MAFFNYSTMQMAAKIVYYGPGLGGKTTNLLYIYGHTSKDTRGEMVSLETATDRTLFFDLLPIEVGSVAGFKTKIQLYTVPGQVFYNTTRKLVLKGVDGVVFVADSQAPMLQADMDSFRNLEDNLAELGLSIEEIPLVLQYNKRDLPAAAPVDELDNALNRRGWPRFEASAIRGDGVFETLKEISKLTLVALKKRVAREGFGTASRPAARVAAAPPPQPAVLQPTADESPQPVAAGVAASQAGLPERAPCPPVLRSSMAPPVRPPSTSPRPAGGRARPMERRTPRERDALAELERIRAEALGGGTSSSNGRREIAHDVRLSLGSDELARARRCTVHLDIEDGDARLLKRLDGGALDLAPGNPPAKLLLRLNIALDSGDEDR